MSDIDAEPGPVDCAVIAFPAGKANFSGEIEMTGENLGASSGWSDNRELS